MTKMAVANNPNTPLDTLLHMSGVGWRREVINNPALPDNVRALLLLEEDK